MVHGRLFIERVFSQMQITDTDTLVLGRKMHNSKRTQDSILISCFGLVCLHPSPATCRHLPIYLVANTWPCLVYMGLRVCVVFFRRLRNSFTVKILLNDLLRPFHFFLPLTEYFHPIFLSPIF